MSAAPNPVAALMQRLVASRLGGGAGGPGSPPPGMPPGGPAGGGAADPEAIGQQVGAQYSELQGVDPGKIVADLNEIKAKLAALFPIAVLRVADAGKGISQAVGGVSAAIKAFEKAQETLKSSQPPIGLSAAQPMPREGGNQPPGVPGMLTGIGA